MSRYGLSRDEIKAIITESMNSNPDLKYYINDDYVLSLMDLMVDGVARAIEENTEHVVDKIIRDLWRGLR